MVLIVNFVSGSHSSVAQELWSGTLLNMRCDYLVVDVPVEKLLATHEFVLLRDRNPFSIIIVKDLLVCGGQ